MTDTTVARFRSPEDSTLHRGPGEGPGSSATRVLSLKCPSQKGKVEPVLPPLYTK